VHYKRPKRTQFFCHGTVITSVVRTAADACFTKGFRDIVLLFQETDTNITDLRYFVRFVSESLMRNPKARIRFLIQPLGATQSPESFFERSLSFREYRDHRYLQGLLSKYAPMTMDELFQVVSTGDTLDELLREAPRDSLWITTRPSTARAAVAWCRSHRVPLPSSVAVLCFNIDKASDFTFQGIATCSPDWPTIGYIMAHSLIGDIPIKKSRKGFLPTPAVLYERGTMP
jgi:DNA-binding LacI/PurR family transcriptional regulator